MTFIQRVLEALDANLWKFIKAVHSANHDYPYHDFIEVTNEDEENSLSGMYVVGTENVNAQGDQKKQFTAKRTVIWTDNPDLEVHFNDSKNIAITPASLALISGNPYFNLREEYHTNINVIYYTLPAEATIKIYCEGVLPQEARDAE